MTITQIYKSLLGKEIEFDVVAHKSHGRLISENGFNYNYRNDVVWNEHMVPKKRGIIAGVRHKQQGIREWIGSEEGWSFRFRSLYKVLVVYTDPLRNPHFVPFRFAEPLIEQILAENE